MGLRDIAKSYGSSYQQIGENIDKEAKYEAQMKVERLKSDTLVNLDGHDVDSLRAANVKDAIKAKEALSNAYSDAALLRFDLEQVNFTESQSYLLRMIVRQNEQIIRLLQDLKENG